MKFLIAIWCATLAVIIITATARSEYAPLLGLLIGAPIGVLGVIIPVWIRNRSDSEIHRR